MNKTENCPEEACRAARQRQAAPRCATQQVCTGAGGTGQGHFRHLRTATPRTKGKLLQRFGAAKD